MEFDENTPLELGGAGEADDDEIFFMSKFHLGKEDRAIFVGSKKDKRLFVRTVSCGDTTQFAFNCDVHSRTIVFTPKDEYGGAELEALVNNVEDEEDVYITDFEDDLATYGIPYELREWSQRFEKHDD